ncbi:MAG: lipopolysaccharide heptosyltransferase I [Acidobacteria bacterium]|nr:lipopolysaccharide heptosyltransferase I [Acidobacteriota bacterium]
MSQRILLVRLGSMGDIVHALPVAATLRAASPDARLDWLVEARWQELLEGNPDISNVIPVDTFAWRRGLLRPGTWAGASELVRGLRGIGYDVALDLQGLYKSALLARLSGARERLGFEKRFLKESGAARFYTRRVEPPEKSHVVEMNLALAQAAGAKPWRLRFPLPAQAQDDAGVAALLQKNQVREFFVLSPGGGWGSKCWPVERYAQLHNALARQRGWRSVANAGPGEEHLVSQLLVQARVTPPVHFPLRLGQLVALVRRARLLVSGDTGPLHLAAALGTPCVGLYGPTDPARNGPYGPGRAVVVHHREEGRSSYKHEDKPSPAMLAITVDEVLAAVERCLEPAGG